MCHRARAMHFDTLRKGNIKIMNAVDLDKVIDYKREYESYIKKAKVSGSHLTGLCPFHEDRNASFSADLTTGRWFCHAESRGGNYVSFYAEIHHIDTKEAYRRICENYHIELPEHERKAEPRNRRSYSYKQYAFEKRLPDEWLRDFCHISDDKDKDGTTWMKIPYLKEDGTLSTYRKRYANKEFKWRYGSSGKIIMYGEWRFEEIRKAGYVCLVEGESDSQSMWQMGISCLGVPGASMFKPDMAERLQDLKVYIHQEPDQGGETFLRKVTKGLIDGGFIGKAFKWSCSTIGGLKDPSDLYMKYGKEDAGKKVLKLLKSAEELDLTYPEEAIPEAIADAPVRLRSPEGWIYSDRGISFIDDKTYSPVLVCRTPIILTKRLKNLKTGAEKIEIAFKRDGVWKTAIYPRSTIFTARNITVLADLGCTVTSENAKMLVRFLSALEAENIDIIKKSDATSVFGWQQGKRFIPGHDQGITIDIDPSQRGMAAAYCKAGTLDAWINTMCPHRERDKFRFILAASFAAPLLRIIQQRTFFVYNWGNSKGGKTAGLKAALSVWGDPERLMVNFNATQVGLERTAAFYCDLPLGIDERQLAGKNQQSLEKIVYMISSGTGKIRGAKSGGLQAISQWRTVALATGEEPLQAETSQTGVSTRVLEIYGGPFENEQQAGLMHQQSVQNFGWAGPEFIEKLLKVSEKAVLEDYDEMIKYVSGISNGNSGSHVAAIAAVALADAMIDTWIFRGLESAETGDGRLDLFPESCERAKRMAGTILNAQINAEASDVNENAVQFIVDWIISNQAFFRDDNEFAQCYGRIDKNTGIVDVLPSVLNAALKKEGYNPRKTLKFMRDKEFITHDSDKARNTVHRRIHGVKIRVIEIRMMNIRTVTDKNDDSCDFVELTQQESLNLSFKG